MYLELDTIKLKVDETGYALLTLDRQGASANLMDQRFTKDLTQVVDELSAQAEGGHLRGVSLRSAKSSFFAGGDLDALYATTQSEAVSLFEMVTQLKDSLRRLETLGAPVVACIAGAALGGGWGARARLSPKDYVSRILGEGGVT